MNHREFFDKYAQTWDQSVNKEEFSKIREIVKMAGIQEGERVLDIGCGTGILLPLLKESVGKVGEVVALDLSLNMLKKAREKFGDQFHYIHANVEDMPLKNSCFHKVICFASFPHFLNKKNALCEISRILKPGRKLLIAHTTSRKTINSFHRKIGGPVANDFIPNKKRMISLLKNTGFTNIKIKDTEDFYWASGVKICI